MKYTYIGTSLIMNQNMLNQQMEKTTCHRCTLLQQSCFVTIYLLFTFLVIASQN